MQFCWTEKKTGFLLTLIILFSTFFQVNVPGVGVNVNVDSKSELQKHLGINQVGNTQQGPGGESLLLKQLGKQTTSDPTPDMINQVAPSLANKIPNDR